MYSTLSKFNARNTKHAYAVRDQMCSSEQHNKTDEKEEEREIYEIHPNNAMEMMRRNGKRLCVCGEH